MADPTEKRGRRVPTQKRSRELTQSLLEATESLLLEEGFEALTTNAVAARAGVSIGSLYQYFRTKDELVAEVFIARLHDTLHMFEEALRGLTDDAPPRAVIAAFVSLRLDSLRRDTKLFAAIADHPELRPLDVEKITYLRVVQLVRIALEKYRTALRVPDPDLAAVIVVEGVHSIGQKILVEHPEHSPEQLASAMTDLVTRYLLADE